MSRFHPALLLTVFAMFAAACAVPQSQEISGLANTTFVQYRLRLMDGLRAPLLRLPGDSVQWAQLERRVAEWRAAGGRAECPMPVSVPAPGATVPMPVMVPDTTETVPMPTVRVTCFNPLFQPR